MPDLENVSTDENVNSTEETTNEVDTSAGEEDSGQSSYSSIEDAIAEIERLKTVNADVIVSRNEAKEKLRKLDEQAQQREQDKKKEQGKFKDLYEQEVEKVRALESRFRTQAADTALSVELGKAGALAVETALPLVNRDLLQFDEDGAIKPESVVDAITEVKKKHTVLFGEKPQIPEPRRAGDSKNSGGYLEELKKLQLDPRGTHRDFEALKQKYNMNK